MNDEALRKHKRVPYNEKVLINESLEAFCNDISEGGLFIRISKALLPGSIVSVTFPETGLKVSALVQKADAEGVGLQFTSLKPEHLEGIRAVIKHAETAQSLRKSKPTVLMVEDSENVRRLNKSRLVSEGFSVIEATDGMDALKILGTQTPDIILLDLHMEKMDGYKVMSFLKQNPNLKDIPVIVFSSKFSSEEQSKVFEAGATEFLPKMTTPPAKLVGIIKNILGK